MYIQELKKYMVTYIRNTSGKTIYDQPVEVVDEGKLFRIQDLHVIWKSTVTVVEKNDGMIRVEYNNGGWVELEVVE